MESRARVVRRYDIVFIRDYDDESITDLNIVK